MVGERPAPLFCRRCGEPWPTGSGQCTACGEALVVPTLSEGQRQVAMRLASSVALYFLMLGTILGPTAFFEDYSVRLLVGVALINAGLVAVWTGVNWSRMRRVVLNPGRPEDWGWALVLVPVTVTLALGTEAIFVVFFDMTRVHSFLAVYDHFASVPLLLLLTVVQPAVVEELAFRGIIFDGLDGLLRRREVIVATALMFMILHLALLSLVFLIVMGVALGWLRHRSGSIWPSVALHLLHNAIVVMWSLALSAAG